MTSWAKSFGSFFLLVFLFCIITPCLTAEGGGSPVSRDDFPEDFVFGASTAAFQVEGAAREGGRGPSIWDTFSQNYPGRVKDGSNGNMGVNSYHLYKEDVKMAKKLGLDVYRFSISWSRVLPGGRLSSGVNQEGIDYYNNLIDELLANGIQPFVTLFHWDVPQALEDEYGGFLSPQIVNDFVEFAELCFWEFGDRVKYWITLNEPWTFSNDGYSTGIKAPGRGPRNVPNKCTMGEKHCSNGDPAIEPYLVAHHLLLAHAAAVQLYKTSFQESQGGKIGITNVCHWMEPLDKNNDLDVQASKRALDFMFGWFMEPLTSGQYPESMRRLVGSRLPKFTEEQSNLLKGSYDFLGLNYYTATWATHDSSNHEQLSYNTDSQVKLLTEINGTTIGPQTASDWLFVYPQGIYKVLMYAKKIYNVPLVYITENGVDELNNPNLTLSEARMDDSRIAYHQQHLYYISKAIKDGVNVKGYIIWALIDNFEWSDGFTVRFGLIYVDFKSNFARYPKKSAIWYANFVKSGGAKRSKLGDENTAISSKVLVEEPQKPELMLTSEKFDVLTEASKEKIEVETSNRIIKRVKRPLLAARKALAEKYFVGL